MRQKDGQRTDVVTRLALTSISGDPRDPACWSGTTSNLLAALEGEGIDVVPVDTSLSAWALKLARAMNFARGYAHETTRSHPVRSFYATVAARKLRTLGVGAVLHTGEFDLPFNRDGLRHYLYIDSTYELYLDNPLRGYRDLLPGKREARRSSKEALRVVDHFFPIGDYVADDLLRRYGVSADKITVVGTGRGKITPMTSPKSFERGHILLVARQRVAEKGGYLLLEAMKRVRAAGCDVPLIIVGANELADAARSVPGVELKGRLPWAELESLFHDALLYAMPALHEPWGLVYLEALCAKTPILGLARGSMPELTGNGAYGFMAPDATAESVATTILSALSDRRRLQGMAEAGQRYCLERYSWENTAEAIASVARRDDHLKLEADRVYASAGEVS